MSRRRHLYVWVIERLAKGRWKAALAFPTREWARRSARKLRQARQMVRLRKYVPENRNAN